MIFSEKDIKPIDSCFYNFNKKLESICIRPDHNELNKYCLVAEVKMEDENPPEEGEGMSYIGTTV